MGGSDMVVVWNGRPVRAWRPEPLSALALDLPVDVARSTERAAAGVRRVGDRLPAGSEPLARLLLRAEGTASSNIEGLRAPVAAVATAELDAGAASDSAAWVADNLAVVTDALDAARSGGALTERELHRWHTRLMRHGGLDADLVGAFRTLQGWIGGRGPHDAAYVPPPPDLVPDLMGDLIAFTGRTDIDPVTQAAVAHAQFETIHPYADGNGRLGRLLVLWLLARRAAVAVPPPVSVLVARDPGGYLAGLYWFRTGELARWVSWFAGVVEASAGAAIEWAGELEALLADWRGRVGNLRSDAAARAVLELLPAHPVLSAGLVVERVGVSDTAARVALEALVARGVLEPYAAAASGPGRPRRWWVAGELVDLVGGWAG